MRVLFISSGNSHFGISPLIRNQGESLREYGIHVTYYTLKGKGFWGYLRNVKPLRRYLKSNKFDIVHAHFSFTAFIASLAKSKPLVVSLMGWNIEIWYLKALIKLLNLCFWDACIVKSNKMKDILNIKNISVIPNGVDLNMFFPVDRKIACHYTNWDSSKKHILFAANPKRPIKNYNLVREAVQLLERFDIELHSLEKIEPEMMVYYYNASDVIALSSFAEGSPNVIKEAMACNRPIVSTDVGDVRERFDNAQGCFLSKQNPVDFAEKLTYALEFNGMIKSRKVIDEVSKEQIAQKIISLYKRVIEKQSKNVN